MAWQSTWRRRLALPRACHRAQLIASTHAFIIERSQAYALALFSRRAGGTRNGMLAGGRRAIHVFRRALINASTRGGHARAAGGLLLLL